MASTSTASVSDARNDKFIKKVSKVGAKAKPSTDPIIKPPALPFADQLMLLSGNTNSIPFYTKYFEASRNDKNKNKLGRRIPESVLFEIIGWLIF